MLCDVCIAMNLVEGLEQNHYAVKHRIAHHLSYNALEQAAHEGCQLCQVFKQALINNPPRQYGEQQQAIYWTADLFVDYLNWLDKNHECPFFLFPLDADTIRFDEDCEGSLGGYYIRFPPAHDVPGMYTPTGQTTNWFLVQWDGAQLWLSCDDKPLRWVVRRPTSRWPSTTLGLEWIRECSDMHDGCPTVQPRTPPTRLIDVGQSGEEHLRLVELHKDRPGAHDELYSPTVEYITLSHCWGGVSVSMTTRKNYLDRLKGFSSADLPKTYQDAVTITRDLGFQYLWIDSLCIIQGPEGDWGIECGQMDAIFENAACTIANPDASSPFEGILHLRPSTSAASCLVSDRRSKSTVTVSVADAAVASLPTLQDSVLGQRAWVFQERLLSPRLLYFGRSQLFFECATAERSEQFWSCYKNESGLNSVGISKNAYVRDADSTSARRVWKRLVMAYSECNLTFFTDRLPALSGLARRFCSRYFHGNNVYIAGMWRVDLVHYLDWYSASGRPIPSLKSSTPNAEGASGYVAPSWSWMSFDAPVTFTRGVWNGSSDDLPHHTMTVAKVSMAYRSYDSFGQLTSGLLEGRTRVLDVMCYVADQENYSGRWRLGTSDSAQSWGSVVFDYEPAVKQDHIITLLLLWEDAHRDWRGIATEPVPGLPSTFRRTGLARGSGTHNTDVHWDQLDEREIKII